MIHPRRIRAVRFEGKTVEDNTKSGVFAFIVIYFFIFFISFLAVALFDGESIETSFSAVAACINNIGPGLDAVGPVSNYAHLTLASKLVLSFDMLLGRLEIFPIVLLFSPSVWLEK